MTKLPGKCQPDLSAFPCLSLSGHFLPFCSNLILKPISNPPALVASELCRDDLSVGVSDSTHPFPYWAEDFKVLPSQTEFKPLLQPLVLVPRCLCSLPKCSHSITTCPVHKHWWVFFRFSSFERVLAQGRGQKAFPRKLELASISGQSVGQLRVVLSVLLLHKPELDMKQGNVPHADTVHYFLAALLWILPIFLHLRAQFND